MPDDHGPCRACVTDEDPPEKRYLRAIRVCQVEAEAEQGQPEQPPSAAHEREQQEAAAGVLVNTRLGYSPAELALLPLLGD